MDREPTTRPSLLVRVRDQRDDAVRAQLIVVYRSARTRGLQDANAADLTQEVLRVVLQAIARSRYDRKRGSFRGWLFTSSPRATSWPGCVPLSWRSSATDAPP
jgi:RNA polymerase sigma-70 factor (ECF subfamily)